MQGKLITLEGIDGSGKSTLSERLALELAIKGFECQLLREPGGVELSERIRELVKDPALQVDARAEALLYAAARAQLVAELLQPMLERDVVVILDRFVDSSLAYQGVGRGLGIDQIAEINRFATGGITPNLTLLLKIDPQLARQRQTGRDEQPDRLEAEPAAFFEAIADAYDRLAAAEPERFVVLDATLEPQPLTELAVAAVQQCLTAS